MRFHFRLTFPATDYQPWRNEIHKEECPCCRKLVSKNTLYKHTKNECVLHKKPAPSAEKCCKKNSRKAPKKGVRTECGNAKKWIKHSSATCITNMGRGRKGPVEQSQKKPKTFKYPKERLKRKDALGCRMKKNSRARKFHARATLPVSFDNNILQTSCGIIRFISSKNASGKNNKLMATTTSTISRTVLCPSGLCQGLRKKETPHRNSIKLS